MSNVFPEAPAGIPYITTEQMREVDRAMIDDYYITLLQMMENAGRNLAEVPISIVLTDKPDGKSVAVAAGPGVTVVAHSWLPGICTTEGAE